MALTVDPVDAANCVEVLAEALRERCEAVFAANDARFAAGVGRVAAPTVSIEMVNIGGAGFETPPGPVRSSYVKYKTGGGMCLQHGLVLDANGECPYVPLDGEAP